MRQKTRLVDTDERRMREKRGITETSEGQNLKGQKNKHDRLAYSTETDMAMSDLGSLEGGHPDFVPP